MDTERKQRGHLRKRKSQHETEEEYFERTVEVVKGMNDSDKLNVKDYKSAIKWAYQSLADLGILATRDRVSRLWKHFVHPYSPKEAPIRVVMPRNLPDYLKREDRIILRAGPGELDYTLLDLVEAEDSSRPPLCVAVRDGKMMERMYHGDKRIPNIVRYDSSLERGFEDAIGVDGRDFPIIVPRDIDELLRYTVMHAGKDGYKNTAPLEKGDKVMFCKYQNRMHCTMMQDEYEPIEYIVEQAERVHPMDMKSKMKHRGVKIK